MKISAGSGDLKATGFAVIDLEEVNIDNMILSTAVSQNSIANGLRFIGTTGSLGFTAETTVTETADVGVLIENNEAEIAFSKLDITTNGGVGLKVNGTTTGEVKSVDGTISTTDFAALELRDSKLNLGLKDVKSANSSTNGVLLNNVTGTVNISGVVTLTNTTEAALLVQETSANVNATALNVDTSGNEAIRLENQTGTFTVGGGLLSGAKDTTVFITGGNKDTSIGAKILNVENRSVEVTGRTGGTVTFANSITDVGRGIIVHENRGGLAAFTEQVDLDTGKFAALELRNNINTATNTNFQMSFSNLDIHTTSGVGMFIFNGGEVSAAAGAVAAINSTNAPALIVNSPTDGLTERNPVKLDMIFKNITSGARRTDANGDGLVDEGVLGLNTAAHDKIDANTAGMDLSNYSGTLSIIGEATFDTNGVHGIKIRDSLAGSRVTITKGIINTSGALPATDSTAVVLQNMAGDFAMDESEIAGTFEWAVIVDGTKDNSTDSTSSVTLAKLNTSSGFKGAVLARDLEDNEVVSVIDSTLSGAATEWTAIRMETIFSTGGFAFTDNVINGESGRNQVGIYFQSQVNGLTSAPVAPLVHIANNKITLNPNPEGSYTPTDDTAIGIELPAGGEVRLSGGGNKALKKVIDEDAEGADMFGIFEMIPLVKPIDLKATVKEGSVEVNVG